MILKDIILNASIKASAILFPLLTVTYVTRTLGPDNYGMVTAIIAILSFFINLVTLPFGSYAVSKLSKKNDNELVKCYVQVAFFISLLSILVFNLYISFTGLYISFYDKVFSSLVLLSSCLSIDWLYQANKDFKKLFVRTLIIRLVVLFLIFVLIKGESDIGDYFYLMLLMVSLPNIINFFYLIKIVSTSNIFVKSKYLITNELSKLFGNSIVGFNSSIYTLSPLMIAAPIVSSYSFAILSVSERIIRLLISVLASYSQVLIPHQSTVIGIKSVNEKLLNTLNITIVFLFPVFLLVLKFSSVILKIVAGSEYLSGSFALMYISVLLLLIPLSTVFINQYYYAMGKIKDLVWITSVVSILTIPCVYLLSTFYGINGYILSILVIELTLLTLLALKAVKIKELLKGIKYSILYCFVNVSLGVIYDFCFRSYELNTLVEILIYSLSYLVLSVITMKWYLKYVEK